MPKENIEKEVENAVENAKEEKVEKTSDKVDTAVEYEEEFDLFGYERERVYRSLRCSSLRLPCGREHTLKH